MASLNPLQMREVFLLVFLRELWSTSWAQRTGRHTTLGRSGTRSGCGFSPHSLVPLLAGGHRAYVSLISALHLHGLIEQIPLVIFAVTTGPTRVRKTSVGTYSYHRIHPRLFEGFDWYGKRQDFLVATPEKAVVDSFYLSSRRGKRFGSFPEIDLQARFSFKRAIEFAKRIRHDPWTRKYVLQQLEILRRQVTSTP